MEHTPGPWKVIRKDVEGATYGEPIKSVKIVAPDGTIICDNEPYYPMELAEENADLIAAAPELLEECKAWLSSYDGWSDVELAKRVDIATLDRIKFTRAVIAKVRGE